MLTAFDASEMTGRRSTHTTWHKIDTVDRTVVDHHSIEEETYIMYIKINESKFVVPFSPAQLGFG